MIASGLGVYTLLCNSDTNILNQATNYFLIAFMFSFIKLKPYLALLLGHESMARLAMGLKVVPNISMLLDGKGIKPTLYSYMKISINVHQKSFLIG